MIFISKASVYFSLKHPEDQRNCEEIKRNLDSIPGVISVSISRDRDRVAVDYDTTGTGPDRLRNKLGECGCSIEAEHWQEHKM
ncbi:heavy-metal-associated domain-containing protein [Caproicibacter fermentans]|uniref:Cation transporter n=1 Tax=Caproicibacter fermentans TaxID=2576756 RepID=A0A7G8TEM0_9FIRM|nr:heavy-metal-associated domain-containing protein [Caproicibacter fermentans]QNK42061.1 cation transporter [Caproicibacter fermentans]